MTVPPDCDISGAGVEWSDYTKRPLLKIHAERPSQKDGQYATMTLMGREDPSIPESLFYDGVEAVSAAFSVDCSQPVRGTFTSWASEKIGGVDCGQIDEPSDPFDRLARRHCPRTPAPELSSLDAAPFELPRIG